MFAYGGISPLGVLITGGTSEKYEGHILGVPKLSLISGLQALLHEGRLKIHRDIPDAPVLVRELQDYRVEYTPSGQLTFNARAGKHDDLVLALAIAVRVARGDYMSSFGFFELTRQRYHQRRGIPLPDREVIGVDLGQSCDPTALCVVRRVEIATARTPDPNAPLAAEPAPASAYSKGSQQWLDQQERLPHHTRYFLVRHMDDPTASIGGARQGPLPGTWIVEGNRIEELTAHRFQLVSPEPVDEEGERR